MPADKQRYPIELQRKTSQPAEPKIVEKGTSTRPWWDMRQKPISGKARGKGGIPVQLKTVAGRFLASARPHGYRCRKP
jgi:hypothetical protein